MCQVINKQQVTEVFVADQHLLKSNNSNKSCVQQSSTIKLLKYSSIQEYRRIFPIPSHSAECPDPWCAQPYIATKVCQSVFRNEWRKGMN